MLACVHLYEKWILLLHRHMAAKERQCIKPIWELVRLWEKKYKNEDVVQDSFMKGKHWKLENQRSIMIKRIVGYTYDRILYGC